MRPAHDPSYHPAEFPPTVFSVNPELVAQLTLAAYAVIATAAVAWQLLSKIAWQVWVLYFVERIYVPFFFHWRSNRRSPFPADGPALIVANHRSPIDPLLLWMNHHLSSPQHRIRRIRFLMAREYGDVPGIGWITRNVRTINVDRNGKDLKGAKEALRGLKQGDLIGIFPEGRINDGEGLLPADTGVAWLALRSEVPVYPAFIHNSPVGKSLLACFWTRSRVRVVFGDPIDLSAYYGRRKSQELLREVTDLMMSHVAELGGLQPADSVTLPMKSPQRATG